MKYSAEHRLRTSVGGDRATTAILFDGETTPKDYDVTSRGIVIARDYGSTALKYGLFATSKEARGVGGGGGGREKEEGGGKMERRK